MKYAGIGFLIGLAGYVLAALLSYYFIGKFSSNGHDRSVEASMTSLFVFGPIGFVLAFVGGYFWAKHTF
ncbi:hypothetical protein [Spirosoma spitsbergense]|jgi:accessory gene regulator protein AgrB|uniref:hypothetical protein n=1 Tax=Spirosoma spitsbergense TaxID=431554 RepID=UPI000375B6C7|nr:hypothetical protein [Spirosoma spitsbergense]